MRPWSSPPRSMLGLLKQLKEKSDRLNSARLWRRQQVPLKHRYLSTILTPLCCNQRNWSWTRIATNSILNRMPSFKLLHIRAIPTAGCLHGLHSFPPSHWANSGALSQNRQRHFLSSSSQFIIHDRSTPDLSMRPVRSWRSKHAKPGVSGRKRNCPRVQLTKPEWDLENLECGLMGCDIL